MASKEFCMGFLRGNEHGVLATVNTKSQPHTATITYLVNEDWSFYFATRRETKKFANLQENARVALTVGAGPEPISVQLEGTANEVKNDEERTAIMERFFTERASSYTVFLKIPGYDIVVFKIIPHWIRLFRIEEDNKKEIFSQIL